MPKILPILTIAVLSAALSITAAPDVEMRDFIQRCNIPVALQNEFVSQKLEQKYEFAYWINPFYLRGDFNGDGKTDIAVLLKEKVSGKKGMGIFHKGGAHAFIFGAGDSGGIQGDDWIWMDVWSVHEKGPVGQGATEATPPKLVGDALLVMAVEKASGLVYWNGKNYAWYQQGD